MGVIVGVVTVQDRGVVVTRDSGVHYLRDATTGEFVDSWSGSPAEAAKAWAAMSARHPEGSAPWFCAAWIAAEKVAA